MLPNLHNSPHKFHTKPILVGGFNQPIWNILIRQKWVHLPPICRAEKFPQQKIWSFTTHSRISKISKPKNHPSISRFSCRIFRSNKKNGASVTSILRPDQRSLCPVWWHPSPARFGVSVGGSGFRGWRLCVTHPPLGSDVVTPWKWRGSTLIFFSYGPPQGGYTLEN